MKFLSKLFGWLKFIYSDRTLELVQRITQEALPIVKTIAVLTPTLADDVIVRVCEKFLLPPLEWYMTIPEESRGIVLADIAARELEKKFPTATTNKLRLSVEAAVAAMRKEMEG